MRLKKKKSRDPFSAENREWRGSLTEPETRKTIKNMKRMGIIGRPTVVAMGIALFNKEYGE